MFPILLSQWMKDKRNPSMVLLFIGLSIVATLMFGGNINNKMKIDVFGEGGAFNESQSRWIELLNESDTLEFNIQNEQTARTKVREGRADLAVKLMENDYRMIVAVDNSNVHLVEQHIQSVFAKEIQLRALSVMSGDEKNFRESVESFMETPPLRMHVLTPEGEELVQYDMSLQLLYGFSLFLVMFTVGFKVNTITKDKTSGIWNRLILSPVRKAEMYLGHLIYSTLIGMSQVIIVLLIFRFGFGFHFGDRYGLLLFIIAIYILTIVAMSMLLVGILQSPEQFNMLFPSIIPIMPLISGVYMPPGLITNPILLSIAEIIPLTHAMEALTTVSMYGAGWSEVWIPISKLMLIAVLCMGVGINLMERQHV
ncbi:hypothetical protein JCM10914A_42680 [Paenibacillus sp. JCM 10914]|uniref:ABC transporter permease n=1 Tax=Paenibacillus sp. JCM 10914 TaxID=1236974 RepID=UPI0003CC26F0|nr:ABC transporter permease [Paenibacillus sp. JCM 10914]GAE05486.1 hypothetical protein JCM10914_1589 [Paenibacillus sp. JCM 10914]